MSGGRPASLDGSLLARKGDAVPAIPDESPLVLNLDEHRRENASEPKSESTLLVSKPLRAEPQIATEPILDQESEEFTAGVAGHIAAALRSLAGRGKSISSRTWWMVSIVAALLLIVGLWLASGSGDTGPGRAAAEPLVNPAAPENAADGASGLQLNLEPATKATEKADTANPSTADAALPAAAALAATAAVSEVEPAVASVALDKADVASAVAPVVNAPVIPVNIPPGEIEPQAGAVAGVPEIPTAIPKSVSPIPIPKAKPDIAAAPSGGRYAVQLASVAIESRANQEAFRLQKQLGHILGEHEIAVEKAVVAGKGTMYRLRAGGFQTQAEARSTCAQLAELKVNCLALRR